MDSAEAELSTTAVYISAANTAWAQIRTTALAPANAHFARLECVTTGGAITGTIYWDDGGLELLSRGALAEQDTVSQTDIENYAVARTSIETASANVDINSGSFVEVERVDITIPSTITDSVVLVEASVTCQGNDTGAGVDQPWIVGQIRLLDDDDVVVGAARGIRMPMTRAQINGTTHAAAGYLHNTQVWEVLAANLNADAVNTFKLEILGVIGGTSILDNYFCQDRQLRATLLNGSEN